MEADLHAGSALTRAHAKAKAMDGSSMDGT